MDGQHLCSLLLVIAEPQPPIPAAENYTVLALLLVSDHVCFQGLFLVRVTKKNLIILEYQIKFIY